MPLPDMDIVAVIAAAGISSRLSPIPCSKEILPVGTGHQGDGTRRLKVAIQYLLESFRMAGITKTYIVIRTNKWDIPAFLGNGNSEGMDIAYLLMGLPYGAAFSVNQSFPFTGSSIVAFGFPDIIIHPQNVYRTLAVKLREENADVVLGLFPATNPQKVDMIQFDGSNRISRFVIKPGKTELHYTYLTALWTPVFSKFMNDYLAGKCREIDADSDPDIHVGDVLQAFINEGNTIQYSKFEEGTYIDIGTVDDYSIAVMKYMQK